MIFFQGILFSKESLTCNEYFGLFAKIKRGSTNFLHDFSIKLLFNTVSMDKVLTSHLFSFSKNQTK